MKCLLPSHKCLSTRAQMIAPCPSPLQPMWWIKDGDAHLLPSLHLSLHLRRSLRVSVLPPVSLHDRSDRSLSGLRLSVHSPQETPSPPYSPTSASRSSEAQPQPQQQGPLRLCSDAATYPMYLIIRTQSSRFNSTRTIDIYGRGVLSVKNINFAKSLFWISVLIQNFA